MNGALKAEQYYTYEEWLEMDGSERSELINGEIYMMAPPMREHQKILTEIFGQLWTFLKDKPCQIYPAPFGVKLQKEEDTVLQPDISVICDLSKLNDKGCVGAPNLIVEILSPSTARYDKFTKFHEYRRAGVLEYWIVAPDEKIMTAYRLVDGEYHAEVYSNTNVAPVQVLPGCEIDLSFVFRE
ncbi:MAG: Uma2 family endonuclease [Clostridiales bacterium]|nr:Uma2 family endonuclease [Clostridiales bacterium]